MKKLNMNLKKIYFRKRILITGHTGFKGVWLTKFLEKFEAKLYCISLKNSPNDFLFKKIKKYLKIKSFYFNIYDDKKLNLVIKKIKPEIIFHFAAQAGVRFTLSEPKKYFDDNLKVFFNILDFVKNQKIKKLFFASSSSVYGDQKKYPLSEEAELKEKNFYGFSKKLNEISAKIFSKIYGTKVIGLRFFTVFGEWGRPDMLIFKYLKSNLDDKNFYLNENGKHLRDFTYIDDVTKILKELKDHNFKENYNILNVCSNNPIKVRDVIKKINLFNKKFKYISKSSEILRKIEVNITHGNNQKIKKILKNLKFTDFDYALNRTVSWYINNRINKIT